MYKKTITTRLVTWLVYPHVCHETAIKIFPGYRTVNKEEGNIM